MESSHILEAAVPTESHCVLRIAGTQPELLLATKLRYQAYIAEQGKPYPEADHAARTLSDELDLEGTVLLIDTDQRIAGTVRVNWLTSDPVFRRYNPIFHFHRFCPVAHEFITVCSRLAVAADARNSLIRRLIFNFLYETGLARGTQLCFATCSPNLLPLFRRYGFRECGDPIDDQIAGKQFKLVFVLDDLVYLKKVHSPLLTLAEQHGVKHVDRPWLLKALL